MAITVSLASSRSGLLNKHTNEGQRAIVLRFACNAQFDPVSLCWSCSLVPSCTCVHQTLHLVQHAVSRLVSRHGCGEHILPVFKNI